MQTRKASIKESGEELTTAEWERFDAAVAQLKAEREGEPEHRATVDRLTSSDRPAQAVA